MHKDIDDLCVSEDSTIRDAMAQINENNSGIVFVTNGETGDYFLGTVTDGDVRRGILRNTSLDRSIKEVMCEDPLTVQPVVSDADVVSHFRQKDIRHLPVVDEDNRLRGVHILSDWIDKLECRGERDFSAVIMAGGLGTRLRPLTEDTPKPLVEVDGKPILARIIEHLNAAGASDIYIITRYLADQIKSYFQDEHDGDCELHFVREQKRLGTCGGLVNLKNSLDQPFLLMNGDLLTEVDVEQLFEFHDKRGGMMTMGVRHYTMEVPYGVAEVNEGTVESISEKPVYDFFVNAGIYVVEPDAVDYIPENQEYDVTELMDQLLEQKDEEISSYPILRRWMDIGRPEDLEEARQLIKKSS